MGQNFRVLGEDGENKGEIWPRQMPTGKEGGGEGIFNSFN